MSGRGDLRRERRGRSGLMVLGPLRQANNVISIPPDSRSEAEFKAALEVREGEAGGGVGGWRDADGGRAGIMAELSLL